MGGYTELRHAIIAQVLDKLDASSSKLDRYCDNVTTIADTVFDWVMERHVKKAKNAEAVTRNDANEAVSVKIDGTITANSVATTDIDDLLNNSVKLYKLNEQVAMAKTMALNAMSLANQNKRSSSSDDFGGHPYT